jgi:hypothetical protein
VLAYGEKAGFPAVEYLRVLNLGLFKSPLMDALGGFMVRRDHEPFDLTLDLAAQDLESVLHDARDLQANLPMAVPLLMEVRAAQARGLGARDLTALALLRRQDADLDPAPDPDWPSPRPAGDPGDGPGKGPGPARALRPDETGKSPQGAVSPASEAIDAGSRGPVPQGGPPRRLAQLPPAPPADPSGPARSAGGGATYPAMDGDRTVALDLWRTTHFEDQDGAVWAWVDGQRHATFWRTLGEVERALEQVMLVRIRPGVLLCPQAVQEFKPLLGGRARVAVAGGVHLTTSREAARRLRFLLGL